MLNKKSKIFSTGFCRAKKCQELSMSTVVLIILIIISIAIILVFTFSMRNTGQEQTDKQITLGSTVADTANCNLWGSGLYDDFDCSAVACPKDALCDACKNEIDISSCDTSVSGTVNCDTDCQ